MDKKSSNANKPEPFLQSALYEFENIKIVLLCKYNTSERNFDDVVWFTLRGQSHCALRLSEAASPESSTDSKYSGSGHSDIPLGIK